MTRGQAIRKTATQSCRGSRQAPGLGGEVLCTHSTASPTCGGPGRRRMSQRVRYTALVHPSSGSRRARSVDGGIFGARIPEERIVGSAEMAYVPPVSRMEGIWSWNPCAEDPRFSPSA